MYPPISNGPLTTEAKKLSRFMIDEQIISMIPADESACSVLPDYLLMAVPGVSPDWLHRGTKEGRYNCTKVQINGRDSYFVWWQKNAEDVLFIVCCASVIKEDRFSELIAGIRQIARQQKCCGIGFSTKRRGLIEKIRKFGGEIFGVNMYLE